MSLGKEFSTRNSTVATLPVGALLEVVGAGRLQVVDLPEPEAVDIAPGTKFQSKYGPAVVVDFTSTGDLAGHVDEVASDDEVFYIAEGTSRVRRTNVSNVK